MSVTINYPLSVDWLGLSLALQGDVVRDPKGYIWRSYKSTNVWEQRRVLYTERGDRVCTLLNKPISTQVIAPNSALLEIDNEWLYHGIGYRRILNILDESFDCTLPYRITGLSRLDLAVDFCPDERQKDIILGLGNGRFYVSGKRNRVPFFSINNSKSLHEMWRGFEIPHSHSWGHKTSDVKWKLYYKTKELRDAHSDKCWDKPYIVDMWRECNMDVSNVWRLEVSMHHCNGLMNRGVPINYKEFEKNAKQIFLAMYHQRFQVRANEGHKDKSNDTLCPLLELGSMGGLIRCRPASSSAEHNGRITLLRHLVQSLTTPEVLIDEDSREWVLAHINAIVDNDKMANYFRGMVGMSIEDYTEDVRCQAYTDSILGAKS